MSSSALSLPVRPPPPRRRASRSIHAYLGLEVLKSFVVVVLGLELVLGVIFCFGAVRDFGVDLEVLLPLLLPALAAYLDAAIPVSLLFATALAYGRLIADREIAALKAFGFSYLELSLAPAAIGACLAAVVLVLNFHIIPGLRFARDNLGGVIVEQLRYLGEGSNQSFDFKGFTIWVERFQGEKLEGIFIGTEGGDPLGIKGLEGPEARGAVKSRSYPLYLYAEEGEVVARPGPRGPEVSVELRKVRIHYDAEYRDRNVSTDFKQWLDKSTLSIPVKRPDERRNDKEVGEPELRARIAARRRNWEQTIPAGEAQAAPHRGAYLAAVTEYHRRISMALVALAFPMAAAAVALFLNSPNRLLPLFVSLLVAPSIFYVLEMHGNRLARAGHWPWLSEELGNLGLITLTACLFLALRRRTLW